MFSKPFHNMNILNFRITTSTDFALSIVSLDPAQDIGAKWKFDKQVYGATGNDGITAFKDVIVRAAGMPKDDGRKLLFATGLAEGDNVITGEARLTALAGRNLADPDLGWSLFKEEGQKTLRYLHDTYGVVWMEALRRILLNPDGNRRSFSLCRRDDGSWDWDYRWLDSGRNAQREALVLGE